MATREKQFTDASVRALKAQKRRYEVFEAGRPGFGLRVSESGKKTWVFLYRFQGRTRRMTLGEYGAPRPKLGLADAHLAHAAAVKKLESGIDPGAEKLDRDDALRKAPTVAALATEYLEKHAKAKKRTWAEDERLLNVDVLPRWGNRKAASVTRRDVVLLLDSIVERGAPISANRVRALLSRMFRFAVARHVLDSSPVFGVEKPAEEHKRDRRLTDGEIKHLWANVEDERTGMTRPIALALKLLLVTAQRKGELVAARWSDFDLQAGTWTIPAANAKNATAHVVPLTRLAVDLLAALKAATGKGRRKADDDERREGASEYLLPTPLLEGGPILASAVGGALRRALNAKVTPASPLRGMEWFTPHDLRRTAATGMGELGFDDFTIGMVLNHRSRGVTARYNHARYEAEKRQALEAWSRRLEPILGISRGENVIELPQRVSA